MNPDQIGDPFVKHDDGKTPLALLPPVAIEEMGRVLGYGAKKYSAGNWRNVGEDWRMRYMSAALRHLFAYLRGEMVDAESGLPHLSHALCNLAFLVELSSGRDRPST